MSFHYEISLEDRLILVRFEGAFSAPELIASTRELCADKDYYRGLDGLIDLREIAVAITPEEIEKLVEFTLSKKKRGYGRWAVLVTSPMATALTMLYQQKVSHEHPFAIFSTVEAAASYLGKSLDTLHVSLV